MFVSSVMPHLDTPLHLEMLTRFEPGSAALYGLQWGDPETVPPLRFIRDRYVRPYVNPQHVALEIGPGGGRWTRYLVGFETLWVVDYHAELLDELRKNVDEPNMRFVRNNGTDFPGVEPESIDYVFSFGTFVHLEVDAIEAYFKNLRTILKPGANVVIQYSDKTKIMAQLNEDFSNTTPDAMRELVRRAGYRVLEEDLTSMWHSSLVRFAP